MITAPFQKRIEWIDQTRGILFLFVILCHSKMATDWMKNIYEPIFLTGFFFLSGYLYKKRKIADQLRNIFNRLFIPTLIYSVLWGIIEILLTQSFNQGINTAINTAIGGDYIWFIPCLMLVEIYYTLVNYLSNKYVNIALIFIALISFYIITKLHINRGFWSWDVASYAIGFFALGNIFKPHLLKRRKAITTIFIYLILCIILGSIHLLKDIDMHLNQFNSPLAFLITSILGCIAFTSIMQYLPINRYIAEFGTYTLLLFPFHSLVLKLFIKILPQDIPFFSSGILLLMTIITCFFIGRYTYKYLPILAGKKNFL